MAISMRFLAKASQSFESIVSHAPSPKALRTPKTPKTPKTPMSPFGISPLASLNRVNFFPEDVEKVEKRTHKVPARSVHFANGAWVGNATRLLGGRLQAEAEASSPITDLPTAASATRDAVRARLARQEDRCVPTPPVAGVVGADVQRKHGVFPSGSRQYTHPGARCHWIHQRSPSKFWLCPRFYRIQFNPQIFRNTTLICKPLRKLTSVSWALHFGSPEPCYPIYRWGTPRIDGNIPIIDQLTKMIDG